MTYIFDFDGTLVDSMPSFANAMLKALDEHGVSYPADIIKIITPLGYSGTADYVIDVLGLKVSKEEFLRGAKETTFASYRDTIPFKRGVREKLVKLRSEGHSLNILTASPHLVLDVCLNRLGAVELFDNIWSCDDFSRTKADVKIYEEAASLLGKKTGECIFVDDNIKAVSTAKAAGMIAIGVYDESSDDYVDEFKKTADRYIMSFDEL